jgi:hypothetical protein
VKWNEANHSGLEQIKRPAPHGRDSLRRDSKTSSARLRACRNGTGAAPPACCPPTDLPGFIVVQLLGAVCALALMTWLLREQVDAAERLRVEAHPWGVAWMIDVFLRANDAKPRVCLPARPLPHEDA